MLKLNIKTLLEFFDVDREARYDSSSIKNIAGEELGFALLKKHFETIGAKAVKLTEKCRASKNETSTGCWLDGWLKVIAQDKSEIYFQVEVKCWSFHGYGGWKNPTFLNTNPQTLRQHKIDIWETYWENGHFKLNTLDKVLKKMDPPKDIDDKEILPLACLWAPLHPKGESSPYFEMEIKDKRYFPKVMVFSMSSYLRNLLLHNPPCDYIELDLPQTEKRIKKLRQIFEVI